jgi:hypothetical protein
MSSLPLVEVVRSSTTSRAFAECSKVLLAKKTRLSQNPDLDELPLTAGTTRGLLSLFSTSLVDIRLEGDWVDDDVLAAIGCASLPLLSTLHFRHSSCTDKGVNMLSALSSLKFLDLTYSNGVTYRSVLNLLDHCPEITEIRRQPVWLDGNFHCPWGEIHTYYCDGSFQFTRDTDSAGWVSELVDCGAHLEDKMQYIDAEYLMSNMGVLLKPGNPLSSLITEAATGDYRGAPVAPAAPIRSATGVNVARDDWSPVRDVLVAQYIGREGVQETQSHRPFPDEALCAGVELGQTLESMELSAIISRMKVVPFPTGTSKMPPHELKARIRRFLGPAHMTADGDGVREMQETNQ